ncbi:MAG: sensor histidine kinase [Hamadaea sp.]|nr:sensor histidine kinase [Hamadaea sp.]
MALAAVLTLILAVVALAVAVTWGGRSALFGLATGAAAGAFALARDRLPGLAAAVGALGLAAVAVPIAAAAELPREPGPAMILALSVLVGSAIRRRSAVWAIALTIAYAVIVVGSDLLAPAASSDAITWLAVLGWLGAVAAGLSLRLVDLRRRFALDQVRREERVALARELHDVAAHHLTGIVVQAQAAQIVARTRPAEVADALAEIESAAGDALTATRRVVGVLRDSGDAAPITSQPESLAELVRRFPGPAVDLRTPPGLETGTAGPPELAATVYRVVQESLTNVARHAPAARRVSVAVSAADGLVTVLVSDDGPPGPPSTGDGHGLLGMRERVEALGGTLDAGPGPDGGWIVRAVLPGPSRGAA